LALVLQWAFAGKANSNIGNKQMHVRLVHVATALRLPLTLLASCFLLLGSAQAQPVQEPLQLSQLQNQLAELQDQLASIQKDEIPLDDSRVKSVGSQRVKRGPESVQEDSLHIRLYDLSDIFAVSPNYPAVMPDDISRSTAMFQNGRGEMIGGGFGGGGMGGGGGVFNIPPTAPEPPAPKQEAASMTMRAAQVSMEQLVTTIKETVEPELWGKSRDEAKIQFLGNTLLITATEDMHQQINNLLNLFREHWGKRRTISIETFWIRAAAAEATELLDPESNDKIGAGVVPQAKWGEFLKTAKTEKRVAYSATLTGHNNQTLHALSGRQRQLTLDAQPFEKTKASMWFESPDDMEPFGDSMDVEDQDMDLYNRTRQVVGFRPIRQSFHDGAAIQVTPLATRGGNFVILDLHAKVNELTAQDKGESKPKVFVHLQGGEKAEVELDFANYISYRLNTTLRCPKEQVVLAGGMTYDPSAESDQPNLYLFVKVSVHTIEEDKSDWGKEPAAGN
jgi:hypothetical protein